MAFSSRTLEGKVAVVTGSSSGLGRAIALLFASCGTSLVVCADLIPGSGEEGPDEEQGVATHDVIARRYGAGKGIFVKTNVGVGKDVEDCVAEAVKLCGRLDIMVNNAGVGVEGVMIHEMEEDMWDKTITVNLRSVYLGCKFACAQFLRQDLGPSGHRGWIVNTSSILGVVGFRDGAPAYCASKAAVINLTKQVAIDYAPHRIHCNAICPGFSRTAMTKANLEDKKVNDERMAQTPWGTWGEARDVAQGAVFLVSDNAAWVTGVALPIDGGFLAR